MLNKKEMALGVLIAKRASHLMTDTRSLNAVNVAEKFSNGNATKEELVIAAGEAFQAWQDVQRKSYCVGQTRPEGR